MFHNNLVHIYDTVGVVLICIASSHKNEFLCLVAWQLPRCSFHSLNVSSDFLSSDQFLCKKTSITKLAWQLPAHRETIRKEQAINNISGYSRDGPFYCGAHIKSWRLLAHGCEQDTSISLQEAAGNTEPTTIAWRQPCGPENSSLHKKKTMSGPIHSGW